MGGCPGVMTTSRVRFASLTNQKRRSSASHRAEVGTASVETGIPVATSWTNARRSPSLADTIASFP
jgi:hypothetical protein